MFQIGGKNYELLQDHKNGWNPEAFRDRYSEVLDRYDYIIGDWGYNQLRLKGFYRDGHPKANKDTSIVVLDDYINEYCNFGCAYFVLQKSREVVNKNGVNDEIIAPDIQQLVDAQREQAGTLEPEEQQEVLQHTAGEQEWPQPQQDSTATEESQVEQPREPRELQRREPKDAQEVRERQPREARESRPSRERREPRRQRNQQGSFDKKESRGPRYERQSKENREGRQVRVSREPEGQRQTQPAAKAERAEGSKKNKTFTAPQQNGS
ncbi:YutD-like domain-containing protein [Paenibacillus polymyxa]|uniref:YutD family protein n=1 Tax=Paenibacillus polymyxa TaxID=1406 RepID=UPI00287FCCE6|nr:YutD-like domain-containing protein [Paenibacillus polymyxa]